MSIGPSNYERGLCDNCLENEDTQLCGSCGDCDACCQCPPPVFDHITVYHEDDLTTPVTGEQRLKIMGRWLRCKDHGPFTFHVDGKRKATPPYDLDPKTIADTWHMDGTPK